MPIFDAGDPALPWYTAVGNPIFGSWLRVSLTAPHRPDGAWRALVPSAA